MYQSWLASNNWWIFCFTRCVVQHLGIPEKYLGLQSILEGYICLLICPTFLEVDPKSLDNFISISTQSSGFLHPIFLAFSDLVAGFLRQPGRSCMTAFLQDTRPLVPCATGVPKFWWDWLSTTRNVLGSLLSDLFFVVMIWRRSQRSVIPSLWRDLFVFVLPIFL